MKILDVDLIGYERGDAPRKRAIVDGVMRSLATGFVYVAHDLAEAELDETYALLERFFALPDEAKAQIAVPGSRGQRGYTGLSVETAAGRRTPDWKEMLNWGESAPPGHPLGRRFPDRYGDPVLPESLLPDSHSRLMSFHRKIAQLQQRFLRIVAEGLGAHPTFFDAMVEHGATLTRAVHYPPMVRAPAPTADGEPPVWAAKHGDINLVTALPRATAPGLQVCTDAGWIDAAPPPGHAILNSGLMLEHLSNGRVPTGIHRVVSPPSQEGGRLSVVQFCHPTPSTILIPLASCITPERPQRFGAISAADRLDEVLWQIGLAGDGGNGSR
jgi:isopenicillin N synthase-like dioxygenase